MELEGFASKWIINCLFDYDNCLMGNLSNEVSDIIVKSSFVKGR